MGKTTRKNGVKRLTIIVIAMMLLIAVIGGTYSKYTSTANGSGTISIAKWAVKVNGNNDMSKTEATFDLTFTAENSDTVPGKVAPGGTATTYVDVDLTGTEVSVEFTCTLADTAATGLTSVFGENYNDKITIAAGTPTLQGTTSNMTLNGNSVTVGSSAMSGIVRIPVVLTWNDAVANNAADTTTGADKTSVTIPVTLSVSQKVATN